MRDKLKGKRIMVWTFIGNCTFVHFNIDIYTYKVI